MRNSILILLLATILLYFLVINRSTTVEKLNLMPQFLEPSKADAQYRNTTKDDTKDDKTDNTDKQQYIDDLKKKDTDSVKNICDSVLGYSYSDDLIDTNGLPTSSTDTSTTNNSPQIPYKIPKSILPKDIKETSKCYKINAGYSLTNLRKHPTASKKDFHIDMSDKVNDDFDYFCKDEFGRNYGLVYIDYKNKKCSSNSGKAFCSQHYNNGIRIK
tara:strand:+ start:521 stop:1165 length:645 start_codon:yes stop_codon:yes gene_type:complete